MTARKLLNLVVFISSGEVNTSLSCTAHWDFRFLSTSRRNFLLKSYIHCYRSANTIRMFWERKPLFESSRLVQHGKFSIYVQVKSFITRVNTFAVHTCSRLKVGQLHQIYFGKNNQLLWSTEQQIFLHTGQTKDWTFKRLKFQWSNSEQKQPIRSSGIKQNHGTLQSFLCVLLSLLMLTVDHTFASPCSVNFTC